MSPGCMMWHTSCRWHSLQRPDPKHLLPSLIEKLSIQKVAGRLNRPSFLCVSSLLARRRLPNPAPTLPGTVRQCEKPTRACVYLGGPSPPWPYTMAGWRLTLIGFAACQELSGSSLLARLFLPACSAGIASKSFCLAVLARRGWWGWLTENCTAGRWARKPGRLSLLLGYTAQPVRLNLC